MGGGTERMRIVPEEMRAAASDIGRLSDEARQVQELLQRSWRRLDYGWQSYARENVDSIYTRAVREVTRIGLLCEQVQLALQNTLILIDASDQNAAKLFLVTTAEDDIIRVDEIPKGYVDVDNVNSTSEERLRDLRQILNSNGASAIVDWLDENGVTVEFADLEDRVLGNCSYNGKHIKINSDYAHLSDMELAAILVHEGTHSLNSQPFDTGVGAVDWFMNGWYNIQDDIMYEAYPYPEEYRAFRAEAEFWRSLGDQAPDSDILEAHVDLIFTPNGDYRDVDAVYRDLHNNYSYDGVFNP